MLTRGEDVEAHALRERGWTVSAIARHLGRDRKTARYAASGVIGLMPLATLCRGTSEPDSARQNQLPDAA
jgi:hypothetical protein